MEFEKGRICLVISPPSGQVAVGETKDSLYLTVLSYLQHDSQGRLILWDCQEPWNGGLIGDSAEGEGICDRI